MPYKLITKRYNKIAYAEEPFARVSKNCITLNQAAINLLPSYTTHVDFFIDEELKSCKIVKSNNCGRKLREQSSKGDVKFAITLNDTTLEHPEALILKAYPIISNGESNIYFNY